MLVIYSSTVLTKSDGDGIVRSGIATLTWKYQSLSSNCHFMDESLHFEGVDDTIEGCEIHPRLSLFSDEFLFEVRESDTRVRSEDFYKSFALFCNAIVSHREKEKVKRSIGKIFINANFCEKKLCDMPRCTIGSGAEIEMGVFLFFLCFSQVVEWVILSITSKWKCPIVHPDSSFDGEFFLYSEGFFWIGMDWCHEPRWSICSYRYESDIKSLWKVFAHFMDKLSVSSISGKVDSLLSSLDDKSSPECLIPICDSSS